MCRFEITMRCLPKSRDAIGSPLFNEIVKAEIETLDPSFLPLQQGLSAGAYALYDTFSVMIIRVSEHESFCQVKAGIFYQGIVAGCSCADDPTPTDKTTEYCEVLLEIERASGAATVTLAGA